MIEGRGTLTAGQRGACTDCGASSAFRSPPSFFPSKKAVSSSSAPVSVSSGLDSAADLAWSRGEDNRALKTMLTNAPGVMMRSPITAGA